MSSILFSWVGVTDLKASQGKTEAGLGPIGQAVRDCLFDEMILLSDYSKKDTDHFAEWVNKIKPVPTRIHYAKLSSPTNFSKIYEHASQSIEKTLDRLATKKTAEKPKLTYHISPGTPAMAAVWIILAKTRFPGDVIESSQKFGVHTVSVPFDISAEYLPNLLSGPDERLQSLSDGLSPEAPEFTKVIHQCDAMKRVIAMARRAAPRNVPVLILGESGTGKELIAQAIHADSPWRKGSFISVNCGAIPKELIDSALFGHKKGAFTGANENRSGYIEAAKEGSLFLDEIGDLPLEAQIRLLRVLQEKEVVRVGETKPRPVKFRLIAATNQNLIEMITEGRFRNDLFHRIAVAILQIPPLRERPGDIGLMVDYFLKRLNEEAKDQPGHKDKKLSVSARNLMVQHSWPGNIRELQNTLQRVIIWSPSTTISKGDLEEALLPLPSCESQDILQRPLGNGLDLREVIATVTRSYIERALDKANGNKSDAAKLLGLPSYQTLTNWMKKYGVAE